MAIIYSYPQIGELATSDTIAISDASNGNKTKSVTIGQLDSYINTGQATIVQVDDRVVTGASFNTSDGLLTLTRNGGEIPSVTTNLDGRYVLTTSLATVATSGSYNDLSDKPTIPTDNSQLANGAGYTTNLGIVESLTTTGSSGAATLTGGVLNIPQYTGGGGGGVTSIIAGTGIGVDQITGDVTITNTLAEQTVYRVGTFTSPSGGVDNLANIFQGNASDKRLISITPGINPDHVYVILDIIVYLNTDGGTYTNAGDLYVGPDVPTPSEDIGIKIPATFLNSTTSKVFGKRCAMDYTVPPSDVSGKDLALKPFSTPVNINNSGAELKISYTYRLLTTLFD